MKSPQNSDAYAMNIARQVIAAALALMLISALIPARGETIDPANESWLNDTIILDDPAYFMPDEEDESLPVITSVGKSNVKVNGVKSRNKLVRYTIPEQLLANDENFLRVMIEAEKYIGYPYVYGGGSPKTGFDCSGFVCWVFNSAGVCDVGRLGANGLYSLCTDIPAEEARPGDLVFFEKTMGSDVKGITHVGIYVGNHMMIHAGDPVGFADLKSDKWAKKLYGYGRLPID